MSLIRRVATRFVFHQGGSRSDGSSGFVSFISVISMLGLALGVTALLTVTSVMNGFERELKNALTAFHGHVLLFSRSEPVTKPERYVEEIRKTFPDVVGVSPYIFSEAMLSSGHGISGSVVEGADLPTLSTVSKVAEKISQGRLPEDGKNSHGLAEIALGSEIARKLHVGIGNSVVLTIPFAKGQDQPLVQKLQVVGIIHLGMYDYDSKYSIMALPELQKTLNMPGRVNAFKILTKDPLKSIEVTSGLNDKYVYPLRARDWSSLNRNLFYAIRLEKVVIGIILLAIVVVASFNIISTLMMLVHDKRSQISMLKALGWGRRQTFAVFLFIGFWMSILGTILGFGFARVLCAIVLWKSIVDLPGDIYVLSRVPVEIRPWEWAFICAVSVILAVVATLWPSYRVSKESPIEGLRYE